MDSTKLKKMIMILVAVFAVLTIIIVSQMIKPKGKDYSQQTVLVSKSDLTKGARLTNNVVKWVRYEKDKIRSDYFTLEDMGRGKLNDYMIMKQIQNGQPIIQDQILKIEKTGDYAEYISPGNLAVPISVSYTPQSLNVVQAGDRVDIIFTFNKGNADTGGNDFASRVVAQNVLVLAVSDKPSGGFFGGQTIWMVVELNQDQATRMTVYQNSGRLSVVLKSAGNTRKGEQVNYAPYSSNQLDKEVGVIYGN